MTYEFHEHGGTHLSLENEGAQTTVHVGSSSPGQRQSQSTSFQTGAWSGEPALFRRGGEWVIVLPTEGEEQVLLISGSHIRHEAGKPDLEGAES